jgi:hypothetical protein
MIETIVGFWGLEGGYHQQYVALSVSKVCGKMRKLLVTACLALGFLVSGLGVQTARADHGYGGWGYPSGGNCHQHSGYGAGYNGYRAGYGGYGYGNAYRALPPVVPVYPTAVYQTYGYGVSPFNYGGYGSNYGMGYGSGYGARYGGYGTGYGGVPRVQLRIGF